MVVKKILFCLCAYLAVAFSFKVVFADDFKPLVNEARIDQYIKGVYSQLDFTNADRLSYDAFERAYKGYINLRNEGKLNSDKEIITICDFNLPSTENRMWIIDLVSCKVVFNTYVAHGQGSGEACAMTFSNIENSHQSSLGFYVTGDTYNGDHGMSLRLNGLDLGFNDAALERGIVVHGASYVSEQFINANEKLGRSWGCPAICENLKKPIIETIQGGTCLFIYYQDSKYIAKSYWLNKLIERLPGNGMYADLPMPKLPKPKPTRIVYQYVHGNTVDSTRTVPFSETTGQ